jgi:YHS domain-containing protein
MIRFLIVRILVPLLLFLLIRAALRSIFSSGNTAKVRPDRNKVPAGGELRKDPVCGTYVSVVTGLSQKSNGKTLYFCSEECRKKYV